jgi:hypothetical protein
LSGDAEWPKVADAMIEACEGMDQAFCLDAYQRALKGSSTMGGDKQGHRVL